MDLAAISAFVAVGDRGGFRAAAKAIGMTSAGVSKAVARLESQLGVTLVARTTRSVRLTAAGVAFHSRCKAMLSELEDAGREAAGEASSMRGRLVVSMSRAFGRLHVLPVLADFSRLYPLVNVEGRLSDRPVDLVVEGVDVAVRIGHLPDSSLVAATIARTRFMMCGSPEYLEARGVPQHPDDLRRHEMIGYVAPATAVRFSYRFLLGGAEQSMTLPSRITLDDGEALVAAATRSAGLVMANDYLMTSHLEAGTLVRVLEAFELPSVPISVVQVPTRNSSPTARAFVDMLRSRLSHAR